MLEPRSLSRKIEFPQVQRFSCSLYVSVISALLKLWFDRTRVESRGDQMGKKVVYHDTQSSPLYDPD